MPRPRLPIQRTGVPVKVTEAVAPAALDCMAEPPLHPQLESLLDHAPLKVTAALDSSTRLGSTCNGGALEPPNGCRVIVFTCVTRPTVAVKCAPFPGERTGGACARGARAVERQ